MEVGKLRGDRIAAWTVVCVAHAMLGWMLMRPLAPLRSEAAPDSALDLVWIAAARSPDQPRMRARRTGPAAGRPAAGPVTPATEGAPERQPRAEALPPSTSSSMSAVFIRQAGAIIAKEAPGSFQSDPFADRIARLPGRTANTFRMRPPPSLAERVARVGKLFGGGDDPCRSARDSIDGLSQAGDSRDLQNALDYEKRFCR